MENTRVGLIGAGSISEHHLNAYLKNKVAQIHAICDLNEERARLKADKFGASHVYTDYRELLANPSIDAVSICTWNNTHAEIAIAALKAGKHVLVEKPLCPTVEQALKIEETVRETGKRLQVGFVRRYDTNAKLMREFVDRGEFGEIYYAKASCIRRLGNPGGWFSDKNRSGGGPLIDIGVHVIDICWYLMGRPKVVSVSGNTYNKLGNRANVRNLSFYKAADYRADQNTVEDMANALIRFENGASLLVDVSFTLHAKQDETVVKLFGVNGGFELEPEMSIVSEKHGTILNITPQTDNKSINIPGAFQNEINHFIECCRTNQKPISPVEDGVEMTKMLCAIYESAEKGCEIRFN